MIALLYILVITGATLLGALAGLGGGVIIKPVLDLLGFHDITTISFISSVAVFTMTIYAIIKQLHNGVRLDWKLILLLAIGAMVGGNIGNSIFASVLTILASHVVSIIQAILLTSLLVIVLINMNRKITPYHIKNPFLYILVGLLLGMISSFLGIGGGPINVAVFVFLFNVDLKKATIYSLATILFSQGSKIVTIGCTTGFMIYDLGVLLYILPSAIIGGIIGSHLNKRLEEKHIQTIFNIAVISIIIINFAILIKNI